MKIQEKIENILEHLKQFFRSTGIKKAVLGMSGGVDSALVAKLASMALGASQVTALLMPYEGVSDPLNTHDAEEWARELGIKTFTVPINAMTQAFETTPWQASDLARMNIKARVRANLLYHYANTHGCLVLGTGNKTEAMLGYCTKYGDAACDVQVIGGLFKTEVWQAAEVLSMPRTIIEKAPTAELHAGQTDESEIGASYKEMDDFLKKLEQGKNPRTEKEKQLLERVQQNRHKSMMPPVISPSAGQVTL